MLHVGRIAVSARVARPSRFPLYVCMCVCVRACKRARIVSRAPRVRLVDACLDENHCRSRVCINAPAFRCCVIARSTRTCIRIHYECWRQDDRIEGNYTDASSRKGGTCVSDVAKFTVCDTCAPADLFFALRTRFIINGDYNMA